MLIYSTLQASYTIGAEQQESFTRQRQGKERGLGGGGGGFGLVFLMFLQGLVEGESLCAAHSGHFIPTYVQ